MYVLQKHTSYENFKLKLCTCAQSQLEILTINVITNILYYREIIFDFSETAPGHPKLKGALGAYNYRVFRFARQKIVSQYINTILQCIS